MSSTTTTWSVEGAVERLKQLPTGSVIVFGSGDCGQLGMGEDVVSCPRPKRHPFFEDKEIVRLSAGGLHTLALSRHGKVYSWGCNDEKALGHAAEEFTVSQVHGLEQEFVVQVTCGDSISAALTADGKIFTWGTFRDSKGVIGVKSGVKHGNESKKSIRKLKSKKLSLSSHDMEISSSSSVSSSVMASSVSSMPMTSEIDLPPPADDLNLDHFHIVPTLLAELSHLIVTQIAAGSNHILALTCEGEVYAWGCGEQGQLGRRILERHKLLALHPTRITPRRHRQHGGIVKMICGSYHSFLLARDGTVFAVGLNNFGQLGLDDHEDRIVPEAIPAETWSGQTIVDLAAGEHHSMALSSTGSVFVFGRADFGQMGIEGMNTSARAHPKPILNPSIKAAKQITAGSNHNLVITTSDRKQIYSWGYGEMGQLGHDEEADELVPKRIEAFSDSTTFLDISAGGQHSVVLMTKKL